MPGCKMLCVTLSSLTGLFAVATAAPATAATIFVAMNVSSTASPIGAGGSAVRNPDARRTPSVFRAEPKPEPAKDKGPTMWALLTGSFALVGTVMRRKNRSPSVTA